MVNKPIHSFLPLTCVTFVLAMSCAKDPTPKDQAHRGQELEHLPSQSRTPRAEVKEMLARDYYDELLAAGALKGLFDEYVCFSDNQKSKDFYVMSSIYDAIGVTQRAGDTPSKEMLANKNGLVTRHFVKGVANPFDGFDPLNGHEGS